ncbi:MAG: ABC transporter permease subunit [Spirochaetales bacterium]|nr:ABC transporter permease subunit [Spirochaetales bacterium]
MYSTNKKKLYYLLPLLIPWLFITGGILFTLLQSFNFLNPVAGKVGFSGYIRIYSNLFFWKSMGFSIYIALISSFFSVVAGFFIAVLFWRLPASWRNKVVFYKIFLILPHISVAYLVILMFSRTGLLSSIFTGLGLISGYEEFPVMIFDNGGRGIILGYLLKEIPFAILMVSALLYRIPENQILSARMLGASRLYTLKRVVLPEALPAITSTFFILFLYSFGGFEMPFILGGSKPVMISIRVYDLLFRKGFEYRAEAMAALISIFVINLLCILFFMGVSKKIKIRRALL